MGEAWDGVDCVDWRCTPSSLGWWFVTTGPPVRQSYRRCMGWRAMTASSSWSWIVLWLATILEIAGDS